MIRNACIALGLVAVFALSGCIVVDSPRRSRVVVVERPRHAVVVHRGYCR